MVIPASSLIVNFFRYQKYIETPKISSVSVLWDKKLSTENRDWHPSLLILKLFDTRKFPKLRRVALRIVLVLWDQKFRRNVVTPALSLVWSVQFFDTLNFLKQRRVPRRIISVLWEHKFRGKILTPALSLSLSLSLFSSIVFDIKKFLEHRRVPLRKVSALWATTKQSTKICVTHTLLLIKPLNTPNILKHKTVRLRNVFGTLKPIFFDRNSWHPPSFFPQSFRYQKVLGKQTGSSTRSSGIVRDRNESTKNCASPPLFCQLNFLIPETFSKTQKSFPTK